MTKKYRKKPVVIEAVQFLGYPTGNSDDSFDYIPEWLRNEFGRRVLFFDKSDTLTIITLEGEIYASPNDYIIKGIQGELYPCKPDIFEMTYEVIADE